MRKFLALLGAVAVACTLSWAPPSIVKADSPCVNYTASPFPTPSPSTNGQQIPLTCVNGVLQTNGGGGGGTSNVNVVNTPGVTVVNTVAVTLPPYSVCLLTTNTATVCKASSAVMVGYINNSITAQTATVNCYDNATTNSGTIVNQSGALGISQIVTFPPPGLPGTTNGLTCIASAAVVGTAIDVLYR